MTTYDLHNISKAPRVIYSGLPGEPQIPIVLQPGQRHQGARLAHHVAHRLRLLPLLFHIRERKDDDDPPPVNAPQRYLSARIARPLPPPAPDEITQGKRITQITAQPDGSKPVCHIIGHRGIGDTIHQRGPIKQLLAQGYEVYLETPGWVVYHDLIDRGLKLIHMPTSLHAQRRQIERERGTYQWRRRPQVVASSRRFHYSQQQVDKKCGSIAQAMYDAVNLPTPTQPDFGMPVPLAWRTKARQLIASWNTGGKPILIHRPNTIRPEWMARARNPDPNAYHELFNVLRDKFFVASIGFLKRGVEWIEGPEQAADVKYHDGEFATEDLIGLWAEADMVYSMAGFAPVMAQAVGTPSITVYGGHESWRTTGRAGEHLAPSLGIDPVHPCDCYNIRCHKGCNKRIDIGQANERIARFVQDHIKEPKHVTVAAVTESARNTLIFGTFFVDSPDRDHLTDLWIRQHTTLNPECDFLAVDSQSPIHKFDGWTPYDGQRSKRMYFNFPDNIGHLSRRNVSGGRDGWGRAFCKGLEIACALKYEHVAHIEGDSLFRIPVADVVAKMKADNVQCFSTSVNGTRPQNWDGWVETGLMFFRTEFIEQSKFISKYDWPNRRVAPTPEVIVRRLLGNNLKLATWKALRGDKNQIDGDNVIDLDLDWVTHCHKDMRVYDRYLQHTLGEKKPPALREVMPAAAAPQPGTAEVTTRPVAMPQSSLKKINLGCGTNKLQGWENHDADVDITKRLPWDDNSVSHILCEHCMEHQTFAQSIDFLRECHRVLAPSGVVRIVVPSVEKIMKCGHADYFKFTTKFHDKGADVRGAMHNILFCHGHQQPWTDSLLESTLFFAGFDTITKCAIGESEHPELRKVEGHGKVIGDTYNLIESIAWEGIKQGSVLPTTVIADSDKPVALIVGGGKNVRDDYKCAVDLCRDANRSYHTFLINDAIAYFDVDAEYGVTLHPDKLPSWKSLRTTNLKRKTPEQVWAHKKAPHVTHHTSDQGGSSGLLAVKVARELNYEDIILCGIPMSPGHDHFVRKVRWNAAQAFWRAWEKRINELLPIVRSVSGGVTQQTFGLPTIEWLQRRMRMAA